MKLITLLFILLVTTSYAQIPTNGLVAKFSFDGPGLGLVDDTGNIPSNKISDIGIGMRSTVDRFGRQDAAISNANFDSNQRIIIQDSIIDLNQDFTISYWVKIDSINNRFQYTVSSRHDSNGWGGTQSSVDMYIRDTALQVDLRDPSVSYITSISSQKLCIGEWYHVLFKKNNTVYQLYMNGILEANLIDNHTYRITPDNWNVAGTANNTDFITRELGGCIDDILFYNRSLSIPEITQLYSSSGLVAKFTFDHATSALLDDTENVLASQCNLTNPVLANNQYSIPQTALSITGFDNNQAATIDNGIINLNQAFTIRQQVKISQIGTTDQYLVTSRFDNQGNEQGGVSLYVRSNGKVYSELRSSGSAASPIITLTSNQTFQTNQWYDIAVVRGAGMISLYIDGVLEQQMSFVANLPTVTYWRIGSGLSGTSISNEMNGTIDDILFYDRALPVSELSSECPSPQLINSVSSLDIVEKLTAHAYPNPTEDILYVELVQEESFASGIIRLFDINGQVLQTNNFNHNLIELDMNDLAKGVYFVQLIVKDQSVIKKVVKQ